VPVDPGELRRSFEQLLGKGLVAVSCRRLPDGNGAYYFGPADHA
jgi:hypothetical protein